MSRERGAWQGTVEIAEHLGSDTFVYVAVRDAGRITVRAPGEYALSVGDQVWLTPKDEHIHRFDGEGRAIRMQ